jgi:cyanate lyase
MTRHQVTELIADARRTKGLTYAEIAERIGRPKVWTAAALLGQHPFDEASATALVDLLELPPTVEPVLREVPLRGGLEDPVPTDPTIYRLYEVVQVYGPALKALIHEEFGDGIMSAITFDMDIEREPNPAGDRVRITMSGKFLGYQWDK